jgi:hypothetical protein
VVLRRATVIHLRPLTGRGYLAGPVRWKNMVAPQGAPHVFSHAALAAPDPAPTLLGCPFSLLFKCGIACPAPALACGWEEAGLDFAKVVHTAALYLWGWVEEPERVFSVAGHLRLGVAAGGWRSRGAYVRLKAAYLFWLALTVARRRRVIALLIYAP